MEEFLKLLNKLALTQVDQQLLTFNLLHHKEEFQVLPNQPLLHQTVEPSLSSQEQLLKEDQLLTHNYLLPVHHGSHHLQLMLTQTESQLSTLTSQHPKDLSLKLQPLLKPLKEESLHTLQAQQLEEDQLAMLNKHKPLLHHQEELELSLLKPHQTVELLKSPKKLIPTHWDKSSPMKVSQPQVEDKTSLPMNLTLLQVD